MISNDELIEENDGLKHKLYALRGNIRGRNTDITRFLLEAMELIDRMPDSFEKSASYERLERIHSLILKPLER